MVGVFFCSTLAANLRVQSQNSRIKDESFVQGIKECYEKDERHCNDVSTPHSEIPQPARSSGLDHNRSHMAPSGGASWFRSICRIILCQNKKQTNNNIIITTPLAILSTTHHHLMCTHHKKSQRKQENKTYLLHRVRRRSHCLRRPSRESNRRAP